MQPVFPQSPQCVRHKAVRHFETTGKVYSKVGRALVEAKESGADPYAAIEAVLPWNEFAKSVSDAAQLAQPQTFDHLHLFGDQ